MLRRTANPHLDKQWLILDVRTGQALGFTGSRSDITLEKLRSVRQGRPHVIYELTVVDRYQPPTPPVLPAIEPDDEEEAETDELEEEEE